MLSLLPQNVCAMSGVRQFNAEETTAEEQDASETAVVSGGRRDSEEIEEAPDDGENTGDNWKEVRETLDKLTFSDEGFDWRKDWWKYILLALGGLLVVYLGLRVSKMVYRFLLFALCVFVGMLGANFLEPLLTPLLEGRIPQRLVGILTSRQAGFAIGFAVSYVLAAILIGLLPKNVREGSSK